MEESVKTEQVNAYQYSPLALAYMGDSILDLLVKKYLEDFNRKVDNIAIYGHRQC